MKNLVFFLQKLFSYTQYLINLTFFHNRTRHSDWLSLTLVVLMAVPVCIEQINCPSTFLYSTVAIHRAICSSHISILFEWKHQPFSTEQFLFSKWFQVRNNQNISTQVLPLFVTKTDFGNAIFFPLWTSSKWILRLAAFANVFEHSLQMRFITFCWCTRKWRSKLYFRSKILSQIPHVN